MFNMKMAGKVILCFLTLFGMGPLAEAMPGFEHDRLAGLLLESEPVQGGSKGLGEAKVRAISKWMDNPTAKTGQYRINTLDGSPKVTPSNHQHLRHNPTRAARALSGTREVDLGTLNQARMHKIADVSVTKASGVDGWTVSPKMQNEAKQIISFVEKHKRLPQKLPVWVDESGPVLKNRAASAVKRSSAHAGKALHPGTSQMSRVLTKSGPVLMTCVMAVQSYTVETAFAEGGLDEPERNVAHASNVAGVGGAFCGAKAGALVGGKAGAGIGTLFCPGPGTAIGAGVGAIGGALGGAFGGGVAAQKGAEHGLAFYIRDAEMDREIRDRQFRDIHGDMELSLPPEVYREAGIF